MDKVKEAFIKVRSDMTYLNSEINHLKEEIIKLTKTLGNISQKMEGMHEKHSLNPSTHPLRNQTVRTDSSTHNHSFKALKYQNMDISSGNQGASTDRQTDRQTDRHTTISNTNTEINNSIDNAAEILDSLDSIKKNIRLRFKRLTDQELLVFSAIYQLDEEQGHTDYKTLAEKLNLSESSIRDYVGRLTKKQIPVEKIKINNKNIQLKISDNLKKIASLPTILQLRDI